MTMHPDTNRLATMGAITRAPRIRRHVWVRRIKALAVYVSAVGMLAGGGWILFLAAHAFGG